MGTVYPFEMILLRVHYKDHIFLSTGRKVYS